jgi:hypothetical protein
MKIQLKLLSLDGRGRVRVEKIGSKIALFIHPGFIKSIVSGCIPDLSLA